MKRLLRNLDNPELISDLSSTFTGGLLAIAAVVAMTIILIKLEPKHIVEIAGIIFGGSAIAGIGGVIARQQPNYKKSEEKPREGRYQAKVDYPRIYKAEQFSEDYEEIVELEYDDDNYAIPPVEYEIEEYLANH